MFAFHLLFNSVDEQPFDFCIDMHIPLIVYCVLFLKKMRKIQQQNTISVEKHGFLNGFTLVNFWWPLIACSLVWV